MVWSLLRWEWLLILHTSHLVGFQGWEQDIPCESWHVTSFEDNLINHFLYHLLNSKLDKNYCLLLLKTSSFCLAVQKQVFLCRNDFFIMNTVATHVISPVQIRPPFCQNPTWAVVKQCKIQYNRLSFLLWDWKGEGHWGMYWSNC